MIPSSSMHPRGDDPDSYRARVRLLRWLSAALIGCFCGTPTWSQDLETIFSFEGGIDGGVPAGWLGGPANTISLDASVHHRGRGAGRIHRDDDSDEDFSSLTFRLPVDIDGSLITLTAFVKSGSVKGNFGLWLRQDGRSGPVEFSNNYHEGLAGDIDWHEVSVSAELSNHARTLNFGLALSGIGTVWLDDVQLLVDGVPYARVPKVVREIPQWEFDTEFDEGSQIENFIASKEQAASIATLIEVWGFVKYHHPRVASGDVHIDFELFRAVESLLSAANTTDRAERLTKWLQSLGPVERCSQCAQPPDAAHLPPPIAWIDDSETLGEAVSAMLLAMHENRPAQATHPFISFGPPGNADFSGEPAYPAIPEDDAGYRLLALARLWNIIQYWFPYRDQIDTSWRSILRQTIPRLSNARDRGTYVRELLRFIAQVKDTHANLWTALEHRPPLGDCRVDADVRFIQGEAVVFFSDQRELKRGDLILEVDGEPVTQLVSRLQPFYAASNDAARLRDIGRHLLDGPCGPMSIRALQRVGGESRNLELRVDRLAEKDIPASYMRSDRAGPTYQDLSNGIAYIKLSTIEASDVEELVKRATGKKGLIIDVRNYPNSFVVFELGQRLVTQNRPFARITIPDPSNPGAFLWSDVMELTPTAPGFEGAVAILVDSSTISQAEYTAMALRAGDNARIVGNTTAGADGNASWFYLPGDIRAMISGLGVFYPDKRPTQRVGIVPDIEVHPTIDGVRGGRDEVLEAALRYVLGNDVPQQEIESIAAYPNH